MKFMNDLNSGKTTYEKSFTKTLSITNSDDKTLGPQA